MSELLTADDVAKILKVRVQRVRELTRRGLVPHIRLGRQVRYRPEAIEEWLREIETAA
jgi:excisionase family DNA binding protein